MRLTNSQPALKCLRDSPLPSVATGLSPTPNRCISDFANAPSKFLASLGTSDMPNTLSDISLGG